LVMRCRNASVSSHKKRVTVNSRKESRRHIGSKGGIEGTTLEKPKGHEIL
jgi:hypothetical protein